jgi:hypothetical protein
MFDLKTTPVHHAAQQRGGFTTGGARSRQGSRRLGHFRSMLPSLSLSR